MAKERGNRTLIAYVSREGVTREYSGARERERREKK